MRAAELLLALLLPAHGLVVPAAAPPRTVARATTPTMNIFKNAFANDAAGETCYYSNPILQISQWQHPKLTYLNALARAYSAPDASENDEIERD